MHAATSLTNNGIAFFLIFSVHLNQSKEISDCLPEEKFQVISITFFNQLNYIVHACLQFVEWNQINKFYYIEETRFELSTYHKIKFLTLSHKTQILKIASRNQRILV